VTFIRALIHHNDNLNLDSSGVDIFVKQCLINDTNYYLSQVIGSLFYT